MTYGLRQEIRILMLESPHNLRESTMMQADPFSDILKLTNAESLGREVSRRESHG